MRTFFITLPEDIIARNIFYTDFWPSFLEQNSENKIVILVKPEKQDFFCRKFLAPNVVVESFERVKNGRLEKIIMSLARSGINTHTNLWSKMRSYKRGDSSLLVTFFKIFHQYTLGNFSWYKRLLRRVILSIGTDSCAISLLDRYNPTALISTSLTNYDFDVVLCREARRKNIKIIGMVRSWDNLSSHGLLRIEPDVLLLQNRFLKDVAIQHQSIKVPIEIFGIPHYDKVFDLRNMIISRVDFLKIVGLGESEKYFFYGAMGEFLFLHEGELPDIFESILESDIYSENTKLIYRSHPKFKINNSIKKYKNIFFDREASYTNILRDNDLSQEDFFWNCLYHSEAVITGASTIALDALALKKNVICIGFDGITDNKRVSYWESVKRFYDLYTHFEVLLSTGAIRVVYNKDELELEMKNSMNFVLDDKKEEKALSAFVKPFDGSSGLRLATLISKYIV